MKKLKKTYDVSGRMIQLGDTVTTLSGDLTGKICDICKDVDVSFVRVRPLHQSYGRGVWHAADRMIWMSTARPRKPKAKTTTSSHARKG